MPIVPCESYGPRQRDSIRLSVFPNLNYSGLYESVMSIIDVVPMVQQGQLGKTTTCVLSFQNFDVVDWPTLSCWVVWHECKRFIRFQLWAKPF